MTVGDIRVEGYTFQIQGCCLRFARFFHVLSGLLQNGASVRSLVCLKTQSQKPDYPKKRSCDSARLCFFYSRILYRVCLEPWYLITKSKGCVASGPPLEGVQGTLASTGGGKALENTHQDLKRFSP